MVRFEGVAARYGDEPEVLRDLNFDLPPGSFHFLTGPSGSGKTTLMRLLYLSLRPSRGKMSVFGTQVQALPRKNLPEMRRRIGVVFQDFRLLNHLDAVENVALPLRVIGVDIEHYHQDVEELLDWVGLGEHKQSTPDKMSGGEQQRLAIARAVVGKPDLILADEPTGNVDPEMGLRLMRLFKELNRLGTTIVIATHDKAMIDAFPANILRLKNHSVELERAG